MRWIIARLHENSTWRGIVWLLTVAGLSLRPDQAEAIVTVGMALAGLLGVFLSDGRSYSSLRDSAGSAGDPATSGTDVVRDPKLPEIELVGNPMGTADRNDPVDHRSPHQRAVSTSDANQLRDILPPGNQPRPYQSTDPNTYPRFGTGFGDRD